MLPDISHLHFKRLSETAKAPTKAHATDAGWDLYADENCFLALEDTSIITTNLAIKIPEGFVGYIMPRSSMNAKGVLTHTGVIDAGYNGAIKIALTPVGNAFSGFCKIQKGDKIAQLVIQPILNFAQSHEVQKLWDSERGTKGFGSSGE